MDNANSIQEQMGRCLPNCLHRGTGILEYRSGYAGGWFWWNLFNGDYSSGVAKGRVLLTTGSCTSPMDLVLLVYKAAGMVMFRGMTVLLLHVTRMEVTLGLGGRRGR